MPLWRGIGDGVCFGFSASLAGAGAGVAVDDDGIVDSTSAFTSVEGPGVDTGVDVGTGEWGLTFSVGSWGEGALDGKEEILVRKLHVRLKVNY